MNTKLMEEAIENFTRGLGIRVTILPKPSPTEDGFTMKARLPPMIAEIPIEGETMLSLPRGEQINMLLLALETLQAAVFKQAHEHLDKHDNSARSQSYQRIAKGALELAMQFVPATHPEYGELEHLYEYVTRSR